MDVTYAYDHNGMRIRKSAGQHITNYTLRGDKIVYLTWGTEPNDKMRFEYDGQGRPAIVNFNGADYHYLYNLQGDVVGLLDNTGSLVVEYNYDAWGRIIGRTGSLVGTLGWLNPFRYRGYVYDEETRMYYLKSRYYNPEWGRFINADVVIKGNLFAYCHNSPVQYADRNGKECTECTSGHSFTADRYYLNKFDSAIFSQWMTGAYTEEDLQPLIKDMLGVAEDQLLSNAESLAYERLFGATNAVAIGIFVNLLLGAAEVINEREASTGLDIKHEYTEARSNAVENYGAIIDVYGGSSEVVLSITLITSGGYSEPMLWRNTSVFDEIDGRSIASIAKYLENTFIPIHHGHPDFGTGYDSYIWE